MCDFYSFSLEIDVTLSFMASTSVFLSLEPLGLTHHRRREQEPLGGVDKIYTMAKDPTVHPNLPLISVWVSGRDPLLVGWL
jgi:hypothetical protein